MNKLIAQSAIIVPICAGMEGPGSTTDNETRTNVMDMKSKALLVSCSMEDMIRKPTTESERLQKKWDWNSIPGLGYFCG